MKVRKRLAFLVLGLHPERPPRPGAGGDRAAPTPQTSVDRNLSVPGIER